MQDLGTNLFLILWLEIFTGENTGWLCSPRPLKKPSSWLQYWIMKLDRGIGQKETWGLFDHLWRSSFSWSFFIQERGGAGCPLSSLNPLLRIKKQQENKNGKVGRLTAKSLIMYIGDIEFQYVKLMRGKVLVQLGPCCKLTLRMASRQDMFQQFGVELKESANCNFGKVQSVHCRIFYFLLHLWGEISLRWKTDRWLNQNLLGPRRVSFT